MSENTTPTAAEIKAALPAFMQILEKSERAAAAAKNIDTLTGSLARNASRMKYLAMAASAIADGCAIPEPDRGNCAGYLLDILGDLGGVTADAAGDVERAVSEALEGAQP